MKDSSMVIIAVSIGIAFAVAQSAPMILGGYPSGFRGVTSGQGDQFFGGMANMMTTQGQTIPVNQAIQMMRDVPQYANVLPGNDTIIFGSQNIKLVVLATDYEGASNLTANPPPSYATDDVFVIRGLVNPTLALPHGATVQIIVINLDKDMYHDFVVLTLSPPYPYMAMQGMMNNWQQGSWIMMSFLPPAAYNQDVVHEYSYTMTLNSQANLWYLCAYPGHAQIGMYGKVLVS